MSSIQTKCFLKVGKIVSSLLSSKSIQTNYLCNKLLMSLIPRSAIFAFIKPKENFFILHLLLNSRTSAKSKIEFSKIFKTGYAELEVEPRQWKNKNILNDCVFELFLCVAFVKILFQLYVQYFFSNICNNKFNNKPNYTRSKGINNV